MMVVYAYIVLGLYVVALAYSGLKGDTEDFKTDLIHGLIALPLICRVIGLF
jgi:hypothetical protein